MSIQDLTDTTRPDAPHKHHRTREAASIIAALAGGGLVLGIAFLVVSTTAPWDAPAVSIVLVVLVIVWLSGMWWRWDSPDRRLVNDERERRGY